MPKIIPRPSLPRLSKLTLGGLSSAGGRSYGAGGRVYGYHHGLNAYMPGIAVRVHDASTKRALNTNYDRFELTSESYIDVPDAGGNWPLTLSVHNATLFSPETATRGGEALAAGWAAAAGGEAGGEKRSAAAGCKVRLPRPVLF